MGLPSIFVFGIDRAGKTVITNYLSKGTLNEEFKPTLAAQQHMLVLKKIKSPIWDMPGQVKFRKMWMNYVAGSKVLVFVVDTCDKSRFLEANKELIDFLHEYKERTASLIVVFHKMDLPDAKKNLKEAKEIFDVSTLYDQQIFKVETTIRNPSTLDKLKSKIEEIFNASSPK